MRELHRFQSETVLIYLSLSAQLGSNRKAAAAIGVSHHTFQNRLHNPMCIREEALHAARWVEAKITIPEAVGLKTS